MSRRKPSLRIGGGVLNRNTLFEKVENGKPHGPGLLGPYNDSGTEVHSQINSKEGKQKHGSTNMDSKVADFLKEIDELDSPSYKATSDVSAEVSWGDWQQCIDETTKHPYYWNTTTNKVTWILPEEIANQFQSAQTVCKPDEKSPKNSEVRTGSAKDQGVGDTNSKVNKLSVLPVSDDMDVDVEAELDQALITKAVFASSILDLELELLRNGLLPVSSDEREELNERFEDEILRLEIAEEEKRKSSSWIQYKEEIDLMNKEIHANKAKWKKERFPMLMNMNSTKDLKEEDESNENKQVSSSEVSLPKTKKVTEISQGEVSEKFPSTNEDTRGESSLDKAEYSSTSEVKESLTLPKNVSEIKNDDDMEKEISATSKVIKDKLAYLEISRNSISDFHVLLIELQVRLTDWKKNVLPSSYLLTKLQEAVVQLKNYEENATPQGWSCHWDSSVKRYFYKNDKTQEMQWHYPIITTLLHNDCQVKELTGVNELAITSQGSEGNAKKRKVLTPKDPASMKKIRSDSPMSGGQENSSAGKLNNENSAETHSKDGSDAQKYPYTNQNLNYAYRGYHQNYAGYAGYQQYRVGQSNVMTSATQNLRGSPLLPNATGDPIPPPPGEESGEDGSSDAPPPLPTGPDEPPPPLPLVPPEEESENGSDEDDGVMMEMSDGEIDDEETPTIVTQVPTAVRSQQPILYKPTELMQSYYTQQITTDMYYTMPTVSNNPTSQFKVKNISQPVATSPASQLVDNANKLLKKKKVKKAKKPAQAKKPPKEMTSLVAQWQKAKQQIEEEDRMLEEEEEVVDNTELSRRQFEKWKEEQILSGKSQNNANFTPIPKNWRERLIKKKSKS